MNYSDTNDKRLILFLGSGVSFKSKFPSVKELTIDLLNNLSSPATELLNQLNELDIKYKKRGGLYVQGKGYASSGEIYRQGDPNYEDLYHLCNQIALYSEGLQDGSVVATFVESLVKSKQDQDTALFELGHQAAFAKRYIEEQVIKGLRNTPKEIPGLDTIIELATNSTIGKLDIVTLNHDLLVETQLTRKGIKFIDGFGEPDGDIRWFNSEYFSLEKKVKLIKLHGSIDWYSFQKHSDRFAKLISNQLAIYTNSNYETMELEFALPIVITGRNKATAYNKGIYTHMFYQWQKTLYEKNIMVMCGYGWGDEAINSRIYTWLYGRKENKLFLLYNNPDDQKLNKLRSGSIILDTYYDNLENAGKIIWVKQWLSEITGEDLIKLIDECLIDITIAKK